LLRVLSSAVEADLDEVMALVENWRLMGKGLGLIDFHLTASALLFGTPLWTLDKRLRGESARLDIAY